MFEQYGTYRADELRCECPHFLFRNAQHFVYPVVFFFLADGVSYVKGLGAGTFRVGEDV